MDKVWKPSESYLELTEASETRWMIFGAVKPNFYPDPVALPLPHLYLHCTYSSHDIIDTSD